MDAILCDQLHSLSQSDSSYLSEVNNFKINIGLKREGKKENRNIDDKVLTLAEIWRNITELHSLTIGEANYRFSSEWIPFDS